MAVFVHEMRRCSIKLCETPLFRTYFGQISDFLCEKPLFYTYFAHGEKKGVMGIGHFVTVDGESPAQLPVIQIIGQGLSAENRPCPKMHRPCP